jgi:hypothetical protein
VARTQKLSALGDVEVNRWPHTRTQNDGRVALTSGSELQGRDSTAAPVEGLRSYLQSPIKEAAGGVRSNPMATKWGGAPPEPKVDVQGLRALQADTEKTSGVSFSFSDADASDDTSNDQAAEQPIELNFNDESAMLVDENGANDASVGASTAQTKRATRPVAPWHGAEVYRAPEGLPEPVNLRALEPEQFAAGRILQVPAYEAPEAVSAEQDQQAEQTVELKPLEAVMVEPTDSRLVNGGRPRVEVGRPSVAVDRLASMSIIPGKPRLLTVDADEPVVASDPVDANEPLVAAVVDKPTVPSVLAASANDGTPSNYPSPVSTSKTLQSVLVPSPSPDSATASQSQAASLQGHAAVAASNVASEQPTQSEAMVAKTVDETILGSFNLKPTEVRAIKIDSPVTHVQSDNMAVCAVLKAASGQVQLIATGVGTTRLSVQSIGPDGIEKLDRYEVAVGEARPSNVDSPDSIAMTLTQTVQSAFPGSNVLVSAEAGRLVVTGSSPDEDSARRMLRMIRSACAIPVIDRVKVR